MLMALDKGHMGAVCVSWEDIVGVVWEIVCKSTTSWASWADRGAVCLNGFDFALEHMWRWGSVCTILVTHPSPMCANL